MEGEILAPECAWVYRYVEHQFPAGRIFGFSLAWDPGRRALQAANDGSDG